MIFEPILPLIVDVSINRNNDPFADTVCRARYWRANGLIIGRVISPITNPVDRIDVPLNLMGRITKSIGFDISVRQTGITSSSGTACQIAVAVPVVLRVNPDDLDDVGGHLPQVVIERPVEHQVSVPGDLCAVRHVWQGDLVWWLSLASKSAPGITQCRVHNNGTPCHYPCP